jgi:hypothetical protein
VRKRFNRSKQRKQRRNQNLCSLCFLLLNSGRDGDADFVLLARDTQTPYVDNRPLLDPTKPEIREYKAMFVLGDEEIGLFSHELVVNCAP